MRDKCTRLVEHKYFTRFILIVIIANAIILGVETVHSLSHFVLTLLIYLDKICIGIFIIELILKLIAYRHKYFVDSWRIFDFIVVLISIIPAAEYISVMRALRIIRVLRLISNVPAMRRVVNALVTSLPGLFSTGALLLLIFYVYAVMGVRIFGGVYDEWFGTLGRALYTLFQVMTLESWSMGISRPVMQEFPYAWIYFVSFILLSAFIFLNFLIGIIVDALARMKHEDEVEERVDQMQIIIEKLQAIEEKLQ